MKKYKNQSIEAHGQKWDSLSELARYEQLLLFQKAGEIKELKAHSKEICFVLLSPCTYKDINGKTKRQLPTTYTPDFMYLMNSMVIAEDVKGMVTDAFRIKAKMFRSKYPNIILRLVKAKYSKKGFSFEDI
jgi:hypothetical protein